jgi:AraC-like DNA-binding protein
MIKTILLLTPVYITFFWSILLNFHSGSSHAAKRFLGKFMLACVVVYLTHFLYYTQLTNLVRLIEPLYHLASLSVYPLFYIYFRLLFVEKNFSFRKHGVYLLLPAVISLMFLAAELLLPSEVFTLWLYKMGPLPSYSALHFLSVLDVVISIVYVVQVLFTVTANLWLINSYRKKARNYYSDFNEIQSQTVVVLNIVLVVCGLTSIVLSIMGRKYFISEMTGIILASIIFSTMLFAIGWLGFRQKAINPTFEEVPSQPVEQTEELALDHRQKLMEKITNLFKNDHIHLNTKLTIQDVAQTVGTNRTYVSSIINQHYGVNFCTFVNNFRIEELESMLKKYPDLTNQLLAEGCGFGSVDSLKRAVNAKTGLSVTQWKANLANQRKKN